MVETSEEDRALEFVPVALLADRPHVMVDGAPRPGTALTLSHWPGTPTPHALWADLSAEIVLKARADPGAIPPGVGVATIDHFDADGVIALALLVVEGLADSWGPLLVEAARVGDFDVVTDPRAALVAYAVNAVGRCGPIADATRSALALLPALAQEPEAFEALWGAEAGAADAARAALADGAVVIDEIPALDLAVVTADTIHPGVHAARWGDAVLHCTAVHSATTCLRVALITPGAYEVRFRYESWVRLTSRRPRLRVDLAPLAALLGAAEPEGAMWEFDGAGALTPALHLSGGRPTRLDTGYFTEAVCTYLEEADARPPAWDPYVTPGSG